MKDECPTYSKQPVFKTEDQAKQHAKDIGGGWVHRLFDYTASDFDMVSEYNNDTGKQTHRYFLKQGHSRKYYGWHVSPFVTPNAKIKRAA